jgi:serine/threonine protein kinase
VNNDGLDNTDGNLIVFENDIIGISRRHIHTISNEKVGSMEFRILSLLGQGTFAQVFQCQHVQTSKLVAIKIIKNKSAYTKQAAVEIDVFRALVDKGQKLPGQSSGYEHMVNLLCYFMYRSHLCLVFELLGLNLYEVLKRRQFRGLPLPVVRSIVRQAIEGVKVLSQKSIVHCDLKPENILLENDEDSASAVSSGERRAKTPRTKTTAHKEAPESIPETGSDHSSNQSSSSSGSRSSFSNGSLGKQSFCSKAMRGAAADSFGSDPEKSQKIGQQSDKSTGSTGLTSGPDLSSAPASAPSPVPLTSQKIKLIDFGSACFEGHTAHTYIQSRFYRSPEVLVGLPYDSSIDMWSLGCVAAELFLGLPILPGVHEHDQLNRICEMISPMPDWMLDQGSQATKYFTKFVPRSSELQTSTPPPRSHSPTNNNSTSGSPAPPRPQWRLKTLQEYIKSLSSSEIRKKGGMAKLEKQPGNRYFRRTKLADIVTLHGQNCSKDDKELLGLFVHFLYGKHGRDHVLVVS